MANKPASNWIELEKMIMKEVNSVLKQEMAEMVKSKESEHVKTDVYNTYPNPVMYERRGLVNGSLGDEERMDAYLIQDGVLEVVNNSDFNHPWAYNHGGYGGVDLDRSLAENIEFGYGSMSEPWNEARPFIEKTKEEIGSKGLHTETMMRGLRARGLEVV